MPALAEAPFDAEVPLLPLIEEAKSALEKESVSYFSGTVRRPESREVKLALANLKTGEIRIVSGMESNRTFKLENPEIEYRVDWWNGFNSSITILKPENTAVVAVLYALDPKHEKELGQDAIIYSPYSSALLQPELIAAQTAAVTKRCLTVISRCLIDDGDAAVHLLVPGAAEDVAEESELAGLVRDAEVADLEQHAVLRVTAFERPL